MIAIIIGIIILIALVTLFIIGYIGDKWYEEAIESDGR